jgi:hypothetical protein
MKKISFYCIVSFLTIALQAQDKKLFDEIQKAFLLGKIANAKVEIDKIMATPANNEFAETWLWKTRIYAEMLNDSNNLAKYPNLVVESFDAFKKYESLEPDYKLLGESGISYRPLGVIYEVNYNKGYFSYKEKDYKTAFEYFARTAYLSKIIMQKDLKKNGNKLDTLPIMMAGYSAQNSQQQKEAVSYYSFAVDKGFASETDADMFKYMLNYYTIAKDKVAFDKYYSIAEKIYTKEDWEAFKLDYISENTSLDEKLKMFDAEDATNKLSATAYNYFGSMFSNLNKADKAEVEKDAAKKTLVRTKSRDAFKKAFLKDPKDAVASINVGIIYYVDFNDLDDVFRANVKQMQELNGKKGAEKDPKKKIAADKKIAEDVDLVKKANVDVDTKMMETANNSIEWLEKGFVILKDKATKSKTEKTSYKNSINFLSNMYAYKRDKVKGKDIKAYDALDAKYKLYDAEYSKVQ